MLSLLAAVATALLALTFILARELIVAPAETPAVLTAAEPRLRDRRRAPPAEPAFVPAAAVPQATPPAPAARIAPATNARRKPEPDVASIPKVERKAEVAMADISPAIAAGGPLPNAARSSAPATTVASASRVEANDPPAPAKVAAASAAPGPAEIKPAAAAPSAAGFLERLRRGLAPGESQTAAPPPPGGWLGRLRPARTIEASADAENGAASPAPGNMPVLRTNDLRHYLNQRLAASAAEAANDSSRKGDAPVSRADGDKVGPVLKSLDAVLNHVLAAGKGGAPRALLVAGATAKLDATAEAIAIARALAKREQVVLVDLTRGPASISGALGLPRTPGLTDLVAGRAGFEDVVRIDDDSALQVISAGNSKLTGANDDENERFARLFEALTQTYDSVVLHADREAVRQLTPALKFELPIMVAVLPAGAGDSGVKTELAEFSALGCPVLIYEQAGKQPRSRFFERVAAG
jgi:Mrp family chromosome partitioning ATPase